MGTLYSWASPDVVSHMTLPQLMMYLSESSGGEAKPKGAFKNRKEMLEYIKKYNAEHPNKAGA